MSEHTETERLLDTADDICREVGSRWREDTAADWWPDDGRDAAAFVGIGPVGQSRDSDCLEQSNFCTILSDLQSIDERVMDIRFGHWAVGWVEEIAIPLDNAALVERVTFWCKKLDNYPVADDEDYMRREHDELWEYLTYEFGDDAEIAAAYLYDAESVTRYDDISRDGLEAARAYVETEREKRQNQPQEIPGQLTIGGIE